MKTKLFDIHNDEDSEAKEEAVSKVKMKYAILMFSDSETYWVRRPVIKKINKNYLKYHIKDEDWIDERVKMAKIIDVKYLNLIIDDDNYYVREIVKERINK